jgi:hypothetical protein
MVAIQIGDVSMGTLDNDDYARVLAAAAPTGGTTTYPNLFGLSAPDAEIEPMGLLDELAHLGSTPDGREVAVLIGTLRDDLMAAVAAVSEG